MDGYRMLNFRNFRIRIGYGYARIFSDMGQELKNQYPLTSDPHAPKSFHGHTIGNQPNVSRLYLWVTHDVSSATATFSSLAWVASLQGIWACFWGEWQFFWKTYRLLVLGLVLIETCLFTELKKITSRIYSKCSNDFLFSGRSPSNFVVVHFVCSNPHKTGQVFESAMENKIWGKNKN